MEFEARRNLDGALEAAGFGVEDIDFVVCTHMHVDHVGWNTRLLDGRWIPTFPKARYLFAKGEFDNWTEQHAKTPALLSAIASPDRGSRPGGIRPRRHAVDEYVRLANSRSHAAPCSICFGRDDDAAVMIGDLLHSPLQARYPELSSRFDVDRDQSAKTRRRFSRILQDADLVLHGPFPVAVG